MAVVGRISELLTERDTGGFGIAVIDTFAVAATRHEKFGMPYLVQHQANTSFVIVHTKVSLVTASTPCMLTLTLIVQDIEFDFNAQHDCLFAGCGSTGKHPRVQERIESPESTESFIEHRDIPWWIINTHSLHNGHLLRRCLPQDLIIPIPIIDPTKREEEHRKFAAAHRPKQDAKRTEAAQKRAAKRLKTKTETTSGDKVLGKRKANLHQKDVDADVVMDDKG